MLADGASEQARLRWLLSLRLVCVSWASVILPMGLFPRARLVVPREILSHCSPEFIARTCRAFAHKPAAPLELCIGRKKVCYPGPLAVSAIVDSPDIAAVSVVCCLGRSASTRVPLKHLGGTLARLLAAGKIVALSLGTEEDRCSINELVEIVRVFRGHAPIRPLLKTVAGDSMQTMLQRAALVELDDPALAPGRAQVRRLHITPYPRLLGQQKASCYFAKLIKILPNLESIAIDHCGVHYRLIASAISPIYDRSRRLPTSLTSLTLDGTSLEPYIEQLTPQYATTLLPPTLVTLSLRDVSVSARNFPSLVASICALEGIVSCNLSGATQGLPDDACIDAIKGLINKPTLRCLDLSRNWLFTNDYARDEQLARAMLASPTLESLSVKAVCTPAHVVMELVIAIAATRLSRFKISSGVYTTVIPEDALALLSERAPPSCAIVVGKRVSYIS